MIRKLAEILSDFFAFFALEWKRFLNIWNLAAWIIILALLFLSVYQRCNEIIKLPEKQQKFKEIQKKYFEKTPDYEIYSRDGIKVLSVPSPAVIFSGRNAVPVDLTLKFDSVVMLQIINNYKGKSLAKSLFPGAEGFAGIVLKLVSILVLWYGFAGLPNRHYLKFLCRLRSKRLIFWCTVISRFLLITAAFIIINALLYAFVRARGIVFTGADHAGVLGNLAATLVMLAVFFAVGVLLSSRKASVSSFILMFIAWYVLVTAVPGALGTWAEKNFPDTMEDYQTQLENFETVVEFEEYAENKNKKFDRNNIEGARKIIKEYLECFYPKIDVREGKLKSKIESTVDKLDRLSLLCPTTFYMSTVNETGSRGYLNYIAFYQYGRDMKKQFVLFYIHRTFYNDPNIMVSFIKGSEDIFTCRSQLPRHFIYGIVLNLCYAAALLLAAYFGFKRRLFPAPKKPGQFNPFDLNIAKSRVITFSVDRVEFVRQLLNLFFGQGKRPGWKITLDGKEITGRLKTGCAYLFKPDFLPGELRPVDLLLLFKRLLKLTGEETEKIIAGCGREIMNKHFSALDRMDKAGFLLALVEVRTPGVIIFNDFTAGMPGKARNQLAERVEQLKEAGAVIIDIVSGASYWLEPDTRVTAAFEDGIYKLVIND